MTDDAAILDLIVKTLRDFVAFHKDGVPLRELQRRYRPCFVLWRQQCESSNDTQVLMKMGFVVFKDIVFDRELWWQQHQIEENNESSDWVYEEAFKPTSSGPIGEKVWPKTSSESSDPVLDTGSSSSLNPFLDADGTGSVILAGTKSSVSQTDKTSSVKYPTPKKVSFSLDYDDTTSMTTKSSSTSSDPFLTAVDAGYVVSSAPTHPSVAQTGNQVPAKEKKVSDPLNYESSVPTSVSSEDQKIAPKSSTTSFLTGSVVSSAPTRPSVAQTHKRLPFKDALQKKVSFWLDYQDTTTTPPSKSSSASSDLFLAVDDAGFVVSSVPTQPSTVHTDKQVPAPKKMPDPLNHKPSMPNSVSSDPATTKNQNQNGRHVVPTPPSILKTGKQQLPAKDAMPKKMPDPLNYESSVSKSVSSIDQKVPQKKSYFTLNPAWTAENARPVVSSVPTRPLAAPTYKKPIHPFTDASAKKVPATMDQQIPAKKPYFSLSKHNVGPIVPTQPAAKNSKPKVSDLLENALKRRPRFVKPIHEAV